MMLCTNSALFILFQTQRPGATQSRWSGQDRANKVVAGTVCSSCFRAGVFFAMERRSEYGKG